MGQLATLLLSQNRMKEQAVPIFWRKIALQIGIIVITIAALSVTGWKGYKIWQVRNLIGQARTHLEKGDYQSALLAGRRAIDLSPSSEPATRIVADIVERAGISEAVQWRRRVAELNPSSTADTLTWARTAVKFGQFSSAKNALNAVPRNARANANFQQLAAGVAVGLGRPQDAGVFFAEAARMEPANEQHQLNHAHWTLEFDRDPAHRQTAEAVLRKLAESSQHSLHARRALVAVRVREGKWEAAFDESTPVVSDSKATTADRVQHLDLIERLKKPELETFLATTQAEAKDALAITAVLHWMDVHAHAEAALTWVAALDSKLTTDPNIATGIAACLDSTKQWERLRDHTKTGAWKDKEFLRFAYLSRAQREMGDLLRADNNWAAAATLAVRTRESVEQLILRANRWGWRSQTRELLWSASNGPLAHWSLESLARLYQSELNADGLLRVSTSLAKLDPANDAARNNIAVLSLLLGRDTANATALAAQLFAKHPQSAGIASTHALALHKSGHNADALAALEKFAPAQLRDPAIAPTYGIILAAAGRPEAREILDLAAKAPLLPPERLLVAEARKKIGAADN